MGIHYDIQTGVKKIKTKTALAVSGITLGVAGLVMAVVMPLGAHAADNNGKVPIKVGPVAITGADDIGTCGNVWAKDSFNKFYTLTLNKDGSTYNLQVNYKDGTFVTNGGASPGACENDLNNSNTVVAGITGRTHQEFNIPVSATTTPIPNPDCGIDNAACESANSFLTAVFGAGKFERSPYSFTGHFEAGNNGTWFDTSVSYPFNDRGDITGS